MANVPKQPPGYFPALTGTIAVDLENLTNDIEKYKQQREDYERKLLFQMQDLSSLHDTMAELERSHIALKRQYEEELKRIKTLQTTMPTPPPAAELNKPKSRTVPGAGKFPLAPFPVAPASALGKREEETRARPLPAPKLSKIEARDVEFIASKLPPAATLPRPEALTNPPVIPVVSPVRPISPPAPVSAPLITSPRAEDPVPREPASGSELDDMRIAYNPHVAQSMNIKLAYDFDQGSVVCCVRFSKDGKYLATGANKKAQIYSVDTGACVSSFTDGTDSDADLYLRSVCFSPDGKFLACGAEDKTVKLWDVESGRIYHTFAGHTMDIYSIDYSPDGRFIVSGSGDKKARMWDVEKKKCAFFLGSDEVGPKDGVTSVAISPDGRLVAAASLDKIVRLWDANTGYFLERYEGHHDSVYSVAFSPDGKYLATGSLDKTLKLWDLSESRSRSRCRSTYNGHTDFVLSVAFSPDGQWLISGSKDRTVQFWDVRTVTPHVKLEGHKNSVISVAVNADNAVASGSGDFHAKLWKSVKI